MNIIERINNEYMIYKKHHNHYIVIFTHFLESLSKYFMIIKPRFTIKKLIFVVIFSRLSILSHLIDDSFKQSSKRLNDNYNLKKMFLIERSILLRWYVYPIIRIIM